MILVETDAQEPLQEQVQLAIVEAAIDWILFEVCHDQGISDTDIKQFATCTRQTK